MMQTRLIKIYPLPFLDSTSFTLGADYTTVVDVADAFAEALLTVLAAATGLSEDTLSLVVSAGNVAHMMKYII